MNLLSLFVFSLTLLAQQDVPTQQGDPQRDPVFDMPLGEEIPEAFARINERLAKTEVIRSNYVEVKTLTVLRRPLRSKGRLVFCVGRGMHRVMTEPFMKEWIITPSKITQRHADGEIEYLDLSALPVARAFVDAFLKVASGDVTSLRSDFHLYFRGDAENWTMGFVPRKEPMNVVIASMVLTGHGALLESLVVLETNGDRTETAFQETAVGPPLSAEEEQTIFEQRG